MLRVRRTTSLSYFNSESHSDLLSDSGTSPTRIASFHFNNRIDDLLGRPFPATLVQEILRQRGDHPGLVCVLSAMDLC